MKHLLGVGSIGVGLCLAAACSSRVDLGGRNDGQDDGGSTGGGDNAGGGGNPEGDGGTGGGGGSPGGSLDGSPEGTGGVGVVPPFSGNTTSKKLDVLLVVDNSISMADKQEALRGTIPDLIQRLTVPSSGIEDLHVGVITSSLGGHGSTKTCVGVDGAGIKAEQVNDHGHLVASRPRGASVNVSNPNGFMTWTAGSPTTDLVDGVQGLVGAAGEFGCGFEMTLESAYRFLADPEPYAQVVTRACSATNNNPCGFPEGVDDVLLAQRAAFLRPDSAVAIVILSDENDCSMRNNQSYPWAAGEEYVLRQGSSQCVTNPNDPCCYSCLQASPPPGCPADPACGAQDPNVDAQVNLRCFEQKRRFGLDFLYPVERYVNAFSKPWLCSSRTDLDPAACSQSDLIANPLFQNSGENRDPSMVYTVTIVGVPWQEVGPGGNVDYAAVLGNPNPGGGAPPVPPTDWLMVESISPRPGTGPGGEAIQPSNAGYLANPANGHEWINSILDDLQYACIFPIPTPRDCAAIRGSGLTPEPGCDCFPGTESENNPVCQAPDGTYGVNQFFSKAYPGLRHLALAQGIGANAVVGSICAKNLSDSSQADFGYRETVQALVAELGRSIE